MGFDCAYYTEKLIFSRKYKYILKYVKTISCVGSIFTI